MRYGSDMQGGVPSLKSRSARIAVLVALLFATSSGWAGAGDSVNVFGMLEVHSKSTNTIVSVPWVQLGDLSNRPIRACDLVLTNNLSTGDSILVYSLDRRTASQRFVGWTLGANGWESMISVSAESLVLAPDAENTLIRRGKAIWLTRRRPLDDANNAIPFYLCGQYTVNPAEAVKIEPGDEQSPCFHFVACPVAEDRDLNDYGWHPYNIHDRDTIELPLNSANGARERYTYERATNRWYYWSKGRTKNKVYGGVVRAGTGFWYISRGGRMTIKW